MNNILKFINKNTALFFQTFLFVWILFIPMKTLIYQASYILMLIIIIFHIFYNNKYKDLIFILLQLKDVLVTLLCIIFVMTLSNIFSEFTTFLSWKVELTYIYRYILASIILLYAYKQKMFSKKTLVIFIIVSLLFQSLDGLYQACINHDFLKSSQGLQGRTFNRNAFGMLMAVGSAITLGIMIDSKQRSLRSFYFFLLISIFCSFLFNLIFSYSRASWLTFAVFILAMLLTNSNKISIKKYFLFLGSFIVLISIFYYIPDLSQRFSSIINLDSSERFTIWLNSLERITQRPFLGYGLMSYVAIGIKNFNGTHNVIIEILLYTGVIGLAAYTMLVYLILKEQIKQQNFFYLSISLSLLVSLQFDHSIFSNIFYLSFLSLFAFFIFEKRISNE